MNPDVTATYRVQLNPEFTFHDAAEIAPYLAELGVSHMYASPYLQAAAGSTHGYDVVDPGRVNAELGGALGHTALIQALDSAGLGQVVDIVPNHMAIAGQQNPWWWDVLENGPSSSYATYFDVDWEASEERWPNKVLLPVLGDHYGRILENGEFRLAFADGVFTLYYHDNLYPIDPSSLVDLLGRAAEISGSEQLGFLADSHAWLPRPSVVSREAVARRHRDKEVLSGLLAALAKEEARVAAAIDTEVNRLNGDPDALDALIEQQNYRLAYWRTAGRDLGYRRFFDVDELAGLRVEDPQVFHATHALPIRWVQEGVAQGLRIDHPDGLRDPAAYFGRLREACPEAWILAEKILEPGEKLPEDWPIEGTTGYDSLNVVGGLFVDPTSEAPLTRFYEEFTGEESDFPALVRECKYEVLTELLGSELNRLTALFVDICEQHRRHRDYTRHELRQALRETAVCFPVYRGYVRADEGIVSSADKEHVNHAIEQAIEARPDVDPELFRFLQDLLLLRVSGTRESELAMRFQQLTGAVMAKGVEDTAFYRFHRLICLNEVGGDPSRFGVKPSSFHRDCADRLAEHPRGMLASSTHDTKRSEDVRARIAVLSEIPERWTERVRHWAQCNERHRRDGLPDRNTEYLFYQTIVGAWPIGVDRMNAYMEKAVREAKSHTSWTAQDDVYEERLREFVANAMGDDTFLADVGAFVESLVTPGRINGLAQTLLKLTAPGVPDTYQGTELWDLSLVDPDNRRPVDFALRKRLLDELPRLTPEDIMARMDEGLPKLWLLRQTLRFRRDHPALFGPHSAYAPLEASGAKGRHAVAFQRGDGVITVVPRLVLGLEGDWADTSLDIPEGTWKNVLTNEDVQGGAVPLKDLLARFPVALLTRREPAG